MHAHRSLDEASWPQRWGSGRSQRAGEPEPTDPGAWGSARWRADPEPPRCPWVRREAVGRELRPLAGCW